MAHFAGDIVESLRHGRGTLSLDVLNINNNATSSVKYDGEWKQGVRHGNGRQSFGTASYYEGEFLNGKRHGKGVMVYPSGNVYEGMWSNDAKCGHGTMTWMNANEKYTGMWLNNLQDGEGIYTWRRSKSTDITGSLTSSLSSSPSSPQDLYHGQWKQGKRNGYGEFYYSDGSVYRGEWRNDLKDGTGEMVYATGRVERGTWSADKFTSNDGDGGNQSGNSSVPVDVDGFIQSLINTNRQCLGLSSSATLSDIVAYREREVKEINNVLLRNLQALKGTYSSYSSMPLKPVTGDKVMSLFQLWLLYVDVGVATPYLPLCELSEILLYSPSPSMRHFPFARVLFKDFLESVLNVSVKLFPDCSLNERVNRTITLVVSTRYEDEPEHTSFTRTMFETASLGLGPNISNPDGGSLNTSINARPRTTPSLVPSVLDLSNSANLEHSRRPTTSHIRPITAFTSSLASHGVVRRGSPDAARPCPSPPPHVTDNNVIDTKAVLPPLIPALPTVLDLTDSRFSSLFVEHLAQLMDLYRESCQTSAGDVAIVKTSVDLLDTYPRDVMESMKRFPATRPTVRQVIRLLADKGVFTHIGVILDEDGAFTTEVPVTFLEFMHLVVVMGIVGISSILPMKTPMQCVDMVLKYIRCPTDVLDEFPRLAVIAPEPAVEEKEKEVVSSKKPIRKSSSSKETTTKKTNAKPHAPAAK